MREAGSHGFDDGLLSGKAHCEETHGTCVLPKRCLLFRQQQSFDELLAEAFVHVFDPFKLNDVRANAENHGVFINARASSIKRFISDTAAAIPSMTARATMAWPMFNSTISGMRAIA